MFIYNVRNMNIYNGHGKKYFTQILLFLISYNHMYTNI